jgi:hypothetical protein
MRSNLAKFCFFQFLVVCSPSERIWGKLVFWRSASSNFLATDKHQEARVATSTRPLHEVDGTDGKTLIYLSVSNQEIGSTPRQKATEPAKFWTWEIYKT